MSAAERESHSMTMRPFAEADLFRVFHTDLSSAKHLPTIYAMAVGVKARAIMDLGIGNTTRALRAAAEKTGGCVYSCDWAAERWSDLLPEQTDQWKLFLGNSIDFLAQLPPDLAFDFVMHDAAHHYKRVRADLEAILPKVRQFGLVCLHDTQQTDLGPGMMKAVHEATAGRPVTMTHLPYGAGLTIIRMEESPHGAVQVAGGNLKDGRPFTAPFSALQANSP